MRGGSIYRPHPRAVLKRIAEETLGYFERAKNSNSPVATVLQASVEGTQLFRPGDDFSLPPMTTESKEETTVYEVTRERTCSAVLRMCREGDPNPMALVFASARKPGGGFLTGAAAQEESVCRCSGLYTCLKDNPMYGINERSRDNTCIYTSHMIYSPAVPVIRDSENQTELLDEWVSASFITAPAPNAGVARRRGAGQSQIESALVERINMILSISVLRNHKTLVLGAFGCGVFGNDPNMVSRIFLNALEGPFKGRFSRVVFAVLDPEAGSNYMAYRSTFSHLLEAGTST